MVNEHVENPVLRDLEWVIRSAPMMPVLVEGGASGLGIWEEWGRQGEEILRRAADDPGPLNLWMHNCSELVGKRFEALVSFWLHGLKGFKPIAESLQVVIDGITLGEFDFIVQNREDGSTIHLEVACKYYLASEKSSRHDVWKGINPDDTLYRKMKLLNVQLRLADHPAGGEMLRKKGIPPPAVRIILMKGFLFVPHYQLGAHPLPQDAWSFHHSGWWMPISAVREIPADPRQWIVLERNQWLGLWRGKNDEAALRGGRALSDAVEPILNRYPGVLVVQISRNEESGVWSEVSRGMIVRNQWPLS